MKQERKQILCQCNHCGNKGYLDIVGHFVNHNYDYCDGEPCYWWDNYWFLLKCPVCGDAVLYEECTEEGNFTYTKGNCVYNIDSKLVYPNPYLVLSNTPLDIKSTYESAIKCYSINNEVALIAFRLVLEKVAKDKAAKGKNLVSMINDLSKKKILPQTLKDSGSIIRILGNAGAHSDEEVSISNSDILIVKQLVDYIIEYIYEMPKKIEGLIRKYNLQNKIEEANNYDEEEIEK